MKTNNLETLTEFIRYSTEFASVEDKELNQLYLDLNKSAEGAGVNGFEDLQKYLSKHSAKYLLERFEYIEVTRENKVYGNNNEEKVLLFSEEDSKMYLDAIGRFQK